MKSSAAVLRRRGAVRRACRLLKKQASRRGVFTADTACCATRWRRTNVSASPPAAPWSSGSVRGSRHHVEAVVGAVSLPKSIGASVRPGRANQPPGSRPDDEKVPPLVSCSRSARNLDRAIEISWSHIRTFNVGTVPVRHGANLPFRTRHIGPHESLQVGIAEILRVAFIAGRDPDTTRKHRNGLSGRARESFDDSIM